MSRLLSATACCLLLAAPAAAQDWPAKPLTVVVAFPAGGADDMLAHMLVPRLSEFLGQLVKVENVGGNGGMNGAERVAKAPADGYELLLGTSATQALSQVLHKHPPYNALTDFTPVGLIAEQPFVLIARRSLPGSGVEALVAYAGSNPKRVQYASAGEGSATHLVCSLFNAAAGINAAHIAYNGGANALRDVVAGRIDYFCPVVGVAIAPIVREEVKALAVLSRNRTPVLPELASAHEQGIADFTAWTWFALFLPKGAPPEVSARLHDALGSAIAMPYMQARLKQIGVEVVSPERRTPEYLQKFVENEIAKWAAAIRMAHLKPYADERFRAATGPAVRPRSRR